MSLSLEPKIDGLPYSVMSDVICVLHQAPSSIALFIF